jgi:hypothetical protein
MCPSLGILPVDGSQFIFLYIHSMLSPIIFIFIQAARPLSVIKARFKECIETITAWLWLYITTKVAGCNAHSCAELELVRG